MFVQSCLVNEDYFLFSGRDTRHFATEFRHLCIVFTAEMLSGMTYEEKLTQQTPLCRTPVSEMLQFAAQLLPTINHTEQQQQQQRPSSAHSFFTQPLYNGCLDDPAVLSDSTQFYANLNTHYTSGALMQQRAWFTGHADVGTGSLQDIVGAGASSAEILRNTVAERIMLSSTTAHAEELGVAPTEQPPSCSSIGMAKAMLREIQAQPAQSSAAYADGKESQSQVAEAISAGGAQSSEEPGTEPVTPGPLQPRESPTEALMRALRACSPNAKVSASSVQQLLPELMNQDGQEARDDDDPGEEILLQPCAEAAEDEEEQVMRSLSDCSASSASSSKQGSPRKVRIAARFDVPIEGTSEESK